MEPVIRNYRSSDLERIVALINAADAVDRTEDGTSVEETRTIFDMPGFDPTKNVFVAEDAGGGVVGYANLRLAKEPDGNGFRTGFVVHPRARGRGLEDRLLARLYARAEERLTECDTPRVYFDSFGNLIERARIAALERFGMREVRRFWVMVRPTLDDLAPAQFQTGIVPRAYRLPEDDALMHATDTEVFRDHWGHTEEPLERWQHYAAQSAFKSDLSVIAEDAATRTIAGFCTITISAEETARLGVQRGWIDILGVRRAYRKQGLGTALLLASLHNMREAGAQQAALGCDSENLTGATRIYERVGFVVHKTRAVYRKQIRGA